MKLKNFVIMSFFTLQAWAIDPQEILKKVDEVRNPSESFYLDVKINSTTEPPEATFVIFIKGNNRTLVKVMSPQKNVGKNMLMIDENMWVYVPNLKRSVRVSLSQKLVGEAANGDISRMRWSGDYSAKIEKEEGDMYVLFLEELKKGLTYPKVRAWVKKDNFHPIKAEFLTLSGMLVKTAEYKDYKMMAGKIRPGMIHIVDSLKNSNSSDIIIQKMETKNFPDSLFTEKNLE